MNNPALKRRLALYLTPLLLALVLIGILSAQHRVTINRQAVTLRTGPGLTYAKVKHQAKSERVRIIGQRHDWYKLALSDHTVAWAPVWRVNHQTKVANGNALSEATIVIDAGHGGSDVGAEAVTDSTKAKYMEKTYTLKVAKLVAKKLRAKGARVLMTRTADQYVSLKDRPKVAERAKADAFISFHFNSSPNANEGSGVTAYYYHHNGSKQLAKLMSKAFAALPLTNLGTKFGDFYVLRENSQPAILCELGYINSKHDFKKIRSTAYQEQVADRVVAAVNRFCQLRAGK